MGVIMDKELIDEINYEIQLLIKIGFYSDDEILEIIDDEFIEEDISKDLISNTIKQYIRKSQSPYFINITYPWICMHQLYSRKRYEYYVADMNKKGFKPLGITGWIKMKIKQDLAEPIKSSLDYGITNDDFLLNKNRIKP